jgi:hypothetical protein
VLSNVIIFMPSLTLSLIVIKLFQLCSVFIATTVYKRPCTEIVELRAHCLEADNAGHNGMGQERPGGGL